MEEFNGFWNISDILQVRVMFFSSLFNDKYLYTMNFRMGDELQISRIVMHCHVMTLHITINMDII